MIDAKTKYVDFIRQPMRMLVIKALPAQDGDCFLIQFGNAGAKRTNILVDGGHGKMVVRQLKSELAAITEVDEKLDLLVVTHIDEDHIQGILHLVGSPDFDPNCLQQVFFNSRTLLSKVYDTKVVEDASLLLKQSRAQISYQQGESFAAYLEKQKVAPATIIDANREPLALNEATLTVLTPNEAGLKKLYREWEKVFAKGTLNQPIAAKAVDYAHSIETLLQKEFKEDAAIPNGSSIAFILTYASKKILMLADAHPSDVEEKLVALYGENVAAFDLVKVAHHGSKANTSTSLLKRIHCTNYLISTNKGNAHAFPHKEALAKIAKNNHDKGLPTCFYFNYPEIGQSIFSKEECAAYNISFVERKLHEEVLEIKL